MRVTAIILVALLSATTGLGQPQQIPARVRKLLKLPMPQGPPGAHGLADVKELAFRTAAVLLTAVAATKARQVLQVKWVDWRIWKCVQERTSLTPVPALRGERTVWFNGLWAECRKEVDGGDVHPTTTTFTPEQVDGFFKLHQIERDLLRCLTPLPAEASAENVAEWINGIHEACVKIHDPGHLVPLVHHQPDAFEDVAIRNPTASPDQGPPGHALGYRRSPFAVWDGHAARRLFKLRASWSLGAEKSLVDVEEELKWAGQHG
ncbi:MAG: hypothetical protein M1826_002990 [Phylliscum demangeonii]|nr:MAG: hypothetical protein M1826_002990 [Phylliscum demangeonii]